MNQNNKLINLRSFIKSSIQDSTWIDQGPLCGCLGNGCSDTIWPRNGTNLAEISSYYGYGESNYGYDDYENYLPMNDDIYDDRDLQIIKDWILSLKTISYTYISYRLHDMDYII